MTTFSSYNFKLHGAQYLKDNASIVALAKNVVSSDSYATVTGKIIASELMTGADVTFMEVTNDLQISINGKSINPTGVASAGEDLVVIIRSATEDILCLDATDRIITNEAGDTVSIPATQTFIRELSVV